jgi:hypothetical protein
MVDLHLSRRARLNADLQRRLIIEGARLMARIDPDDLQAAVTELGPQAGPIAQQLHQAGRRWAA